jgi:hypothetical protein
VSHAMSQTGSEEYELGCDREGRQFRKPLLHRLRLALSLSAEDHGLRHVGLSGLRGALCPVVSDRFRRLTHRSELRHAHRADDDFVDVAHGRF